MAPSPYGKKTHYEQPILVLTSKEFLTGISPSAHSGRSGIFYKAAGIAPVNDPGAGESSENGLLRAGPVGTDLTSTVVVDAPVAGVRDYPSGSSAYLYILGAAGHFYQLTAGSHALTDLRPTGGSPGPISNPANGIGTFQPIGGTKYTYYMMKAAIGRASALNSSPSFADTWVSSGINSTTMHPMHTYFDQLMYGNLNTIGMINDNGSGDSQNNTNVLDLPVDSECTALSDDGIYLVIAITNNLQSTFAFSNCRILFWDGASDSWNREYPIDDAYILSMKRVGNAVIVQGIRGVYQVTFAGGVKKILSRYTGLSSTGSNRQIGPALMSVLNQSAVAFGAAFPNEIAVATIGALADDAPSAFHKPILITTNLLINPSFVEAELDSGIVIVGTDQPKLLSFAFGSPTGAETSVSAQTVYLALPTRYQIQRIDIILAAPLIAGDEFNIETKLSETDSAVQFGRDVAYATENNKRHIQITTTKPVQVDNQVSLIVNFEGGAVKIKTIQVYGQLMTP